MSTEIVKQIIGRAVTEPEYRELLFTNPSQALIGYDLTEQEADELKRVNREQFDAVAGELGERVSRVGLSLATGGDDHDLAKALCTGQNLKVVVLDH
jgi:hypothetical protein